MKRGIQRGTQLIIALAALLLAVPAMAKISSLAPDARDSRLMLWQDAAPDGSSQIRRMAGMTQVQQKNYLRGLSAGLSNPNAQARQGSFTAEGVALARALRDGSLKLIFFRRKSAIFVSVKKTGHLFFPEVIGKL